MALNIKLHTDCSKPEPISKISATRVTLRTSWQVEVSDPITARVSPIHILEGWHAEEGHGDKEGTGKLTRIHRN